jgi:pimeloyl-ACP methyl ester carboxylesterase
MTTPSPDNLNPFRQVGQLLGHPDREAARLSFAESAAGRSLASDAPDNFNSLNGFFAPTRPPWTGALLRAIVADGPGITEDQVRQINVPTLIIGHKRDLAHPLAYAEALAAMIPGAKLVEITPKATDLAAYRSEFRAALVAFLDLLAIATP